MTMPTTGSRRQQRVPMRKRALILSLTVAAVLSTSISASTHVRQHNARRRSLRVLHALADDDAHETTEYGERAYSEYGVSASSAGSSSTAPTPAPSSVPTPTPAPPQGTSETPSGEPKPTPPVEPTTAPPLPSEPSTHTSTLAPETAPAATHTSKPSHEETPAGTSTSSRPELQATRTPRPEPLASTRKPSRTPVTHRPSPPTKTTGAPGKPTPKPRPTTADPAHLITAKPPSDSTHAPHTRPHAPNSEDETTSSPSVQPLQPSKTEKPDPAMTTEPSTSTNGITTPGTRPSSTTASPGLAPSGSTQQPPAAAPSPTGNSIGTGTIANEERDGDGDVGTVTAPDLDQLAPITGGNRPKEGGGGGSGGADTAGAATKENAKLGPVGMAFIALGILGVLIAAVLFVRKRREAKRDDVSSARQHELEEYFAQTGAAIPRSNHPGAASVLSVRTESLPMAPPVGVAGGVHGSSHCSSDVPILGSSVTNPTTGSDRSAGSYASDEQRHHAPAQTPNPFATPEHRSTDARIGSRRSFGTGASSDVEEGDI